MPNVKNNVAAQETRRKLIEAAGEVFAERGLHAATIKQITDRAGVNTAAINYHFSDKFELYAAVIRHALSLTLERRSAARTMGSHEQQLRAYVAEVIGDLYDSSLPAWRTTLLGHELAQPTAALDAVVDELIRPRARFVQSIVRGIAGSKVPEKQVLRAALSVWAQCFILVYNSELIRRLNPDVLRDSEGLVEHITEFSMAALVAMR